METFVTPDHLSSLPVAEQLRYVKRGLRGVMNGPVSEQMRNMGLTYRVNFGVELPRLREMSAELPHTYDLAAALWKEDIRECRLLAAMLMPSEAFTEDLAEVWVEQMRFPEEAQCTVQHLFARRPYAGAAAFRWIAREERMFRLCGWLLLSRLMMNGAVPLRATSMPCWTMPPRSWLPPTARWPPPRTARCCVWPRRMRKTGNGWRRSSRASAFRRVVSSRAP